MAAVAPNTAEISSERMGIIRSDDLPGEGTKLPPEDHHEVQFFQEGLDTGARILGE